MDKSRKNVRQLESLKPVLLRSLSKNQLLILHHVYSKSFYSITKILRELSEEFEIPLSTLKLNARELREMELLEYGRAEVRLTELGGIVLRVIGNPEKGYYDGIKTR
jgi:DNA-binding MarR family transcriptional regulator